MRKILKRVKEGESFTDAYIGWKYYRYLNVDGTIFFSIYLSFKKITIIRFRFERYDTP